MADTVPERTTAYLSVTFVDKTGAAAAPASVEYSVYDMTTGTELRAPTAIAPGATIELVLDADDNAIQNAANVRERRRVTVTGLYGAADEVHGEFEYYIANLARVS
ncbi:MAG: hypothetical protein IT495_17020 [Gammaproteobacteria bacterium]|nr:hypothetical protein [Gammaproteobacteria bacterium]